MIIIWIIVAIIMFSLIVLAHEFWHFKAARIFGVKVEEFWLGIPPRAKKLFTDKLWTLYSLNWLPLWGFVKLKWENPQFLKNKDDKDALINKNYIQQSIIMLAWIFMNFVLAFVIFTILFFIWVKPIGINNKIETNLDNKLIPTYEQAIKSWLLIKEKWVILFPIENSIAEKSWIKELDILIWLNWTKIDNYKEVQKIISNNPNKEIKLDIIRWNKNITISVIPSKEGKIWTYLNENIKLNENYIIKYWFIDSIIYWWKETYNQIMLTFKALWMMWQKIFYPETPKEREEAIKQVSWPIWMVDMISKSLNQWISFIIIMWAIISINLWVFNLLPIPALDWWRFVFITINSFLSLFFKKKIIHENIEAIIHWIFLLILIILSIFIAYNDILKIINN